MVAVMMMESTLRQNLLRLSTLFCEDTKRGNTFIGLESINDPKILARIFSGKGFTASTYDRLTSWMSSKWPAGLDWPDDIPRPSPEEAAAALAGKAKIPA